MPICVHVLYTVFMDAVAETGIHLHGECRIVSLSYDDTLLHIYIYIYTSMLHRMEEMGLRYGRRKHLHIAT